MAFLTEWFWFFLFLPLAALSGWIVGRRGDDPVALTFDAGRLLMTCHDYQRACSAVGARNSQPLKAIGP